MPELPEMPDLQELTRTLTRAARDAAVVAVGLGVVGFQRAQVRRVAIQRRLADSPAAGATIGDVRCQLFRHAGQVDGLVGTLLEQLRTTLEPLEEQLPPPAREAAKRAHEQADSLRALVKDLLTVPPASTPPASTPGDSAPGDSAPAASAPGDSAPPDSVDQDAGEDSADSQ